MDPKNKSSVINSRGTCVCYFCRLRLNRHKLKACTQNAHPITISYILLNINIGCVIFCVGCSIGCLCLVLFISFIHLLIILSWLITVTCWLLTIMYWLLASTSQLLTSYCRCYFLAGNGCSLGQNGLVQVVAGRALT